MSVPKRIQRKRTKGWRMPAGAVYVGRPTKWGNPFRLGTHCGDRCRQQAVSDFRSRIISNSGDAESVRLELRGKDLACWCPIGRPCHADVLLELANR